MRLGYCSDVARMWLRCRSDVFSDVAKNGWQKFRERGFQHLELFIKSSRGGTSLSVGVKNGGGGI